MQCGHAPGAMRCSTSAASARGPRRASPTSRSITQCMKIRISAQPRARGAVPDASRCVRRFLPSIAAGVVCARCPKALERHTRAGGHVAGHADGTGALRECAIPARARHAPRVCRCRASAASKRRFPSAARSCAANGQMPAPSRCHTSSALLGVLYRAVRRVGASLLVACTHVTSRAMQATARLARSSLPTHRATVAARSARCAAVSGTFPVNRLHGAVDTSAASCTTAASTHARGRATCALGASSVCLRPSACAHVHVGVHRRLTAPSAPTRCRSATKSAAASAHVDMHARPSATRAPARRAPSARRASAAAARRSAHTCVRMRRIWQTRSCVTTCARRSVTARGTGAPGSAVHWHTRRASHARVRVLPAMQIQCSSSSIQRDSTPATSPVAGCSAAVDTDALRRATVARARHASSHASRRSRARAAGPCSSRLCRAALRWSARTRARSHLHRADTKRCHMHATPTARHAHHVSTSPTRSVRVAGTCSRRLHAAE